MTAFFLGTHKPHWLGLVDVPLFVSRRTLGPMRTLPRARAPWALDSGGFTELSMHGGWSLSARDYAVEVRRLASEVGRMAWAAPQDWMCEPIMLAKTGKTVEEHQRLTINNFIELREVAPDLPWIPVVQGWAPADYWRHVDAYAARGVDLTAADLVGVGTVCRRQGTDAAGLIFGTLHADGLRLHGFGVKTNGLRRNARHLASADSLAWSYNARRHPPIEGHSHANCANCLEWALDWRASLLSSLDVTRGNAASQAPLPWGLS